MKLRLTPKEKKQILRNKIIRQALNDLYVSLNLVGEFNIQENADTGKTKICCKINLTGSKINDTIVVEGSGVGPVDVLFSSLSGQLSEQYSSLNTMSFSEFGVSADLARKYALNYSGSAAQVEALLVVTNARGDDLIFRHRSSSINRAAFLAVLNAIEHFINSEKAVGVLRLALTDAKKRNRGDMVDFFTRQLIELVEVTNYKKLK